jgi:hypothetical protein
MHRTSGRSSAAAISAFRQTSPPLFRRALARAGIASLISIAVAPLCIPQPAEAAQVIATITGTVGPGSIDRTGVFGFPPQSSLVGQSFLLVYTIEDTQGIGTQGVVYSNGKPIGSCIENYTVCTAVVNTSNPITAVLTIAGKPYEFGAMPIKSVSSFAKRDVSSTATSGADQVYFYLDDVYNTNPAGGDQVQVGISSGSVPFTSDYRWQSSIFYNVCCGGAVSGEFTINLLNGEQSAVGYLIPETIRISGPLSPDCIADVNSGINPPELSGRLNSTSLMPTEISAKFMPSTGISQAEADCGVAGFDWVQTITITEPSSIKECANSACTSQTPISANTTVYDPPQFGWHYCVNWPLPYNCTYSPYYYSPGAASSPSGAMSYCENRLDWLSALGFAQKNPTGLPTSYYCRADLQSGDTAVKFYDKPATAGALVYFTTQLVGVPKGNGPPIPLPDVFTWTDNFNQSGGPCILGFVCGTGGITLLTY